MKYAAAFVLVLLAVFGMLACGSWPKKVEFSANFAELYSPNPRGQEPLCLRFVTGDRRVYETDPYYDRIIIVCTGFTHSFAPTITGILVNDDYIKSVVVDVKDTGEMERWRGILAARKPVVILVGNHSSDRK